MLLCPRLAHGSPVYCLAHGYLPSHVSDMLLCPRLAHVSHMLLCPRLAHVSHMLLAFGTRFTHVALPTFGTRFTHVALPTFHTCCFAHVSHMLLCPRAFTLSRVAHVSPVYCFAHGSLPSHVSHTLLCPRAPFRHFGPTRPLRGLARIFTARLATFPHLGPTVRGRRSFGPATRVPTVATRAIPSKCRGFPTLVTLLTLSITLRFPSDRHSQILTTQGLFTPLLHPWLARNPQTCVHFCSLGLLSCLFVAVRLVSKVPRLPLCFPEGPHFQCTHTSC